jgi:hypothetical protein
MPNLLKVSTTHMPKSGITRDAVSNTFWFETNDSSGLMGREAYALAAANAVGDFFGEVPFGFDAQVGKFLSSQMEDEIVIKVYDLIDAVPPTYATGSHIASIVKAIPANRVGNSVESLPSDVAVVLSFRGSGHDAQPEEVEAGPPGPAGNFRFRSYRRGRVYIGPLALNGLVITPAGSVNLAAGPPNPIGNVLLGAARGMGDPIQVGPEEDDTVSWSTFSKTSGIIDRVTKALVDREFDTMRKRGRETSSRITFAWA